MKKAPDGKPLCGSSANELGMRLGVDIKPDQAGLVSPLSGGLSATPDDPKLLPPHVRPASLGGRGRLPVYKLDVANLHDDLAARRDPKHPRKHALIEPAKTMTLSALQSLLCNGRGSWEMVP